MADSPISFKIDPYSIRITTESYGETSVVGLDKVLQKIQDYQEAYIMEVYGGGRENLAELFKDKDRFIRANERINEIVNTKVNYTMELFRLSMQNDAALTRLEDVARMNDAQLEEIVKFSVKANKQGRLPVQAFGTFIQNSLIFGGATATGQTGILSGGNLPRPDVFAIMAELKHSAEAFFIHSGDISYGIKVDEGIDKDVVTQQLVDKITELGVRKDIILLQLYVKMRNFLYLISTVEKSNSDDSTIIVHLSAVLLYIEILIQKLRDWAETGIVEKQNPVPTPDEKRKGNLVSSSQASSGPRIEVERSAGASGKGKQLKITETLKIDLENLSHTFGKAWEPPVKTSSIRQVIENISDLYLTWKSILSDIVYDNTGREATKFLKLMKTISPEYANLGADPYVANMNILYGGDDTEVSLFVRPYRKD